MEKILIILLVLAVLILGGIFMYRHFVTNQIADLGGMENTDCTDEPDDIHMLDGDFTYVDNDVLLRVIAGTWASAGGHYVMVLSDDYRVQLTLDGETVLDDQMQFTYLQPGYVQHTEFNLDGNNLTNEDETVLGEIVAFYHEASDTSGTIFVEVAYPDGSEKTIEFEKTAQP